MLGGDQVVLAVSEDLLAEEHADAAPAAEHAAAARFVVERLAHASPPVRAGAWLGAAAVDLRSLALSRRRYVDLPPARRRAGLLRSRNPLVVELLHVVRALLVVDVYSRPRA
jgi:hypothetical protein